ncbi:MAG: hypothetical protein FJ189_08195, partial [Gammaproteobacteria bacterium]|nr:hypothetical protein [Gammaproteobacteria bacterium]
MSHGKYAFAVAILATLTGPVLAEDPGISVVNREAMSSAPEAYWTTARIAKAQPLLPMREGSALSSLSFGTANLDFSRSRITPQSA